jgi:Fe-S cluster assembly ATP-binding protein
MMGPNGSGKSTLANALMGHPNYQVTKGEVYFGDVDMLALKPNERARQGMFLAFQYPLEIPGVRLQDFLRTSTMAVDPHDRSLAEFMDDVESSMETLKMDRAYLTRYLNDGFSGGEKKRAEILQMMMLKPKIGILDETDSGLDIDALKVVADGVNFMRGEKFSALIITHYQRILNYIIPDKVHIFDKGKIVLTGGMELARELEAHGYEILKKNKKELVG